MPKKRKKYPKLPSGFGTIRYIGDSRRNCYAVHPPSEIDALGHVKRPTAICYVDNWIKGFTVLTSYKAGTYKPGMEKDLEIADTNDTEVLIQRLIADFSTIKGVQKKHPEIHKLTFAELYEKFTIWKFEENKERKLSNGRRMSLGTAYKYCVPLHNTTFEDLKFRDFQEFVDNLDIKYGMAATIVSLIKQMSKYAVMYEYCQEDRTIYLRANKDRSDEKHADPFTEDELSLLWKNQDNPDIEFLIIMCYSGYRIAAYKTLEVNIENNYFMGGVKTAASKDRIVPIHSGILPLVKRRIERDGVMLKLGVTQYRRRMYAALEDIGVPFHTPHGCRHTFSMLCEKYGVNENDRKRLLGHSFGADITNAVYGHRNIEELRAEIEKIKIPNCD